MWCAVFLVHLLVAFKAANGLSDEQGNKICETEECRLAAAILKAAMNKSVDPCENFYSYACGSWEVNFPLPADKDVWGLDNIVEHSAKMEVKEILDEEEKEDDIGPLKYEKWFYKSCMNLDKIEEDGIKPVQDVLGHLGGWPITMSSNWSDEGNDWQRIHEFYSEYKDMTGLFFIRLGSDDENQSRFMIEVTKPTETLYDKLMKGDDGLDALPKYVQFVKNIVSIFANADNKTVIDEELEQEIDEILTFEEKLYQMKAAEEFRSFMTIEELQEFYNEEKLNSTAEINWLQVISHPFTIYHLYLIESTEKIIVRDKAFLRSLSQLLNETPNYVIVNYLHWRFVSSSLKYLSKEVRDLFLEISTKPEDLEKIPERWESCVSDITISLGFKYEYMRRHFTPEIREMAEDMAGKVRAEMLDEVERSAWLDDKAREETLIKLHSLKWHLGLSHFFSGKPNFDRFYNGNVQNARRFFVNRRLRQLRVPRYRGRWIDQLSANVVYDPARKVLVLTAAELSVPLLNPLLPSSANYGYLAPAMAQQIAKTMGDRVPVLNPEDPKFVDRFAVVPPWSSSAEGDSLGYQSKTECLKNQYQNYSVGPLTVDENMFDAIGLRVAYNTFQHSLDQKSNEKLPDLEELNDEQLFFVSFATKYCQSASATYLSEHDPLIYTPNEYRVIGPLSNFDYFAKAFNCPSGSPMNPVDKCLL